MKVKRFLCLCCAALILSACSSEGKTITQTSGPDGVTTVIEEKNGKTTTVFEPRANAGGDAGETGPVQASEEAPAAASGQELECEEAGIRTMIPDYCHWHWDKEAQGLYVYVGLEDRDTAIPYIYITRHRNTSETPEEYLAETTPYMEESYGDKLLYSGDLTYQSFGPFNLASKTFRYRNDVAVVENVRCLQRYGSDLINYSIKYWEGEGDETMEAYRMLIDNFRLTDMEETPPAETVADAPAPVQTVAPVPASAEDAGIRIEEADSHSIYWAQYADPNGYFTMEVPNGWAIRIGLIDYHYVLDLISYGISVYDPACPERMLYFNLNTTSLLKSDAEKQWYTYYYGAGCMYAERPVITDTTTAGYFKTMGPWYGYTDFKVEQNVGKTALGGDLIQASAKSARGVETLGLYAATLDNTISTSVQADPFDLSKGYIDAGFYTAYNVVIETAPVEDFVNYQPVLDHCLSSIRFTQHFMDDRAEVWRQINGTGRLIMSNADAVSAMIMDTWNNSSRSFDILSQKRSDATLGYERVLDTQTGEYLRAETGFGDWYQGSRYELVTGDDAYLSPYAGTIYWK